MDSEVDDIPEGWTLDPEEADSSEQNPTGWKLDPVPPAKGFLDVAKALISAPPQDSEQGYRDVVSDNLRAMGYEPDFSEELERAAEYGIANAYKALIAGATFGASKNVNALKPEEGKVATTLEIAGSFAPISKLIGFFGGTATKLAAKSPVLQKQLGAAGNLLGMGLTGATVKGAEDFFAGEELDADDLINHGVEWVALDAALNTLGVAGKFTAALLEKTRVTGMSGADLLIKAANGTKGLTGQEEVVKGAFQTLKEIKPSAINLAKKLEGVAKEASEVENLAKKALKQNEVTPEALQNKKVTNKTIERLDKEAPLIAEPYQPGQVDYSKEVKALEDSGISQKLEIQSPRAATKEELGTAIKEDVNAQRKAEKAAYKPLYQEAEQAAQTITHHADSTAKTAFDTLNDISKYATKPEGYETVIKKLKDIIKDAGYEIKKTAKGQSLLVKAKNPVTVKDTMELAKRIHKVINYDQIEYKIADKLRDVVAASKRDVRAGLASHENALTAFELAEAEHARVAKKYGTKAVQKVRKTEAGEQIAKAINEPTVLQDLQKTMSPKQYGKVQREVLENIREKDYLSAEKHLREVNKYLSKENQQLAKEIVEAKNPNNPLARQKAVKEAVYNDVSSALTTGTRPQKTLSLWKTQKGQRIVRDAFKNSPNGKEVIQYLEKQSFNDMVSSVMKDGVIDLKKVEQFLKDPAMVSNIRSLGGEEAVQFFKGLEGKSQQIKEGAQVLSKLPTAKQTERGKYLLRKAAEKAKEKPVTYEVSQKTLKPKRTAEERAMYEEAKKGQLERGEKILDKMKRADYPVQSQLQDWNKWIKETLGLSSEAALSIFGVTKIAAGSLGAGASPILAMVGYRMMNKFATSPRVRRAFNKAIANRTDPIPFMLSWDAFTELAMEED